MNGYRNVTARHCLDTYHSRDANASVNYYGSHIHTSDLTATSVLGGGNSTGSALMFHGDWDTSNSLRVAGLSDVSVGNKVVTDGGNSGANYNLVVQDLNDSWNDPSGGLVQVIRAHAASPNTIAVITGDSGGPVTTPYADGIRTGAVGVIQAYPTGTGYPAIYSCATYGVRDADGNTCSQWVWFTSIRAAIDDIPNSFLKIIP